MQTILWQPSAIDRRLQQLSNILANASLYSRCLVEAACREHRSICKARYRISADPDTSKTKPSPGKSYQRGLERSMLVRGVRHDRARFDILKFIKANDGATGQELYEFSIECNWPGVSCTKIANWNRLRRMRDDGMIERSGRRWHITPAGKELLRDS